MIYELVLVTNLGAITPLLQFESYQDCIRQQALTTVTAQASAQCLPARTHQEFMYNINESNRQLTEAVRRLVPDQR